MMWIIILAAVLAVTILGAVYATAQIGRFGAIRKLTGEKRSFRRILSFGILAAGFVLSMLLTSLVNAIIIFLHLVIFLLIYQFIFFLIKKCAKKEFKINWRGWLAIATCVIYLAVGFYLCNNVWQTNYSLSADANVAPLRIAMFADSHVGTTFDGKGLEKYVEEINEQNPDIVLIAGDFVDDGTSRQDMIDASNALSGLKAKYGVWYVFGNHDKGYFRNREYTAEDIINQLKKNNVHVLEDQTEIVDGLAIVGRKDYSTNKTRMSMDELTKDIPEDKYVIVMDHEPNAYAEEAGKADLVLSGHTHGGQMLPIIHVGEWIGVNDRSYGYENRKGTDFIVTSGISDWEILFKTGCKSEYVIIDVNK